MAVMHDEFPLLASLGLYATDTRGDGNCLFHALSDQLYGHQDAHASIRQRVIDYMRDNAAYYKQFIDVNPGGGIRRNPKRKNAGAYSSPANAAAPSQEDVDRVFTSHLETMSRGGTYGDNMEITAFSSAFNVDVKIYQRDFAYMISSISTSASTTTTTTTTAAAASDHVGSEKTVAHIAYHVWEHYSSIRNLDGPHSGPPEVKPKVLTPEEELKQREKLAQTPLITPESINAVAKCLPYYTDKLTIKKALKASKGNRNVAVSMLLDAEENGSASSTQESSSVERDHDSDDEIYLAPNKKQDRRMSRHSRVQQTKKDGTCHLSHLSQSGDSQESIASFASERSSMPPSSQQSFLTQPTDTDTDATSKTDPGPTSLPAKPQIRLKLHPPKPPPDMAVRKTSQKQSGPRRVTAREQKDIKKQAQKKARKERQQASANEDDDTTDPTTAGIAFGQLGIHRTPPVETLRTLYI